MNLEILSLEEAKKFVPEVKTFGIRIFDSLQPTPIPNLIKNRNWIQIDNYFFDDNWSRDWKEYSWVDLKDSNFGGIPNLPWEEVMKAYSIPNKESLIGFLEYSGHLYGRGTLFDENFASKILEGFEPYKDGVGQVIIHCVHGRNRSPAVGIAMNEIYGWGIEGLKEKFPHYRRFVYETMKEVGKDFGINHN